MRVAIIADAHGNLQALQAVLDSISTENIDLIVAAGDMVNPFPGSAEVWRFLRATGVRYLKGNQEEFLIFHSRAESGDWLRSSPRFLPLQYAAGLFGVDEIQDMDRLPLTISVGEGDSNRLLICHASPFDPWRSISDPVDHSLEAQLRRVAEDTIVAGHYHRPWRGAWQHKTLALCGSCGLPMTGRLEASYLIAEQTRTSWTLTDVNVAYDRDGTIRDILDAGFVDRAGPIGWLLLADFLYGGEHLMAYFAHEHSELEPVSEDEYAVAVRSYFERAGIREEMARTFRNEF